MKLIFLYGMPGVGKLTVAKEMVRLLGDFKLFHNQMTVDIISSIFPFASPRWSKLNGEYRRLMYEACAEEDINLNVTSVYAKDYPGNDEIVNETIKLVEDNNSEVCFVHLVCDQDIIFQRIQNLDRKEHRKVSEPEKLKDTMSKWDLITPISYVKNLTVDTGKINPIESAIEIIKYYKLK
ncbi:MAG: AAA family ATPase [Candidatus Heimdallarchaeota archaeon]|nr:AAA family ATPase [Candidatus Heimdallarchaeota archaeon]